MSQDVLGDFPPSFPTRFRGYDRDAVDHEVHELRAALEYAQRERDRAVARALALEAASDPATETASTTVRWLIDSAEQDAARIRAAAEDAAQLATQRADDLLRRRVELVEEAQHEASACLAQAAEEARQIVHDALEKASTLLRGLQESEVSLQEMFGSGALNHRMPPPRRSTEQHGAHHAPSPTPRSEPKPEPKPKPVSVAQHAQHAQPVADAAGPVAAVDLVDPVGAADGQQTVPVPRPVPSSAPPAPVDTPQT